MPQLQSLSYSPILGNIKMSQEQHSVSQIPSFGSKIRPRAGSVSALPSSNSSQTSPHTKKKVVFVDLSACGTASLKAAENESGADWTYI